MCKRFRHAGRITTAAAGDFERPMMPHLLAVVRGVLEIAMMPAAPVAIIEDAPSIDGRLEHIRREYRGKIADARKYGHPADRMAIVMSLKIERAARIKAAQEEHAAERRHIRELRKRARALSDPQP